MAPVWSRSLHFPSLSFILLSFILLFLAVSRFIHWGVFLFTWHQDVAVGSLPRPFPLQTASNHLEAKKTWFYFLKNINEMFKQEITRLQRPIFFSWGNEWKISIRVVKYSFGPADKMKQDCSKEIGKWMTNIIYIRFEGRLLAPSGYRSGVPQVQ